MTDKMTNIRFVFFGTAPLARGVLDALESSGSLPSLIVAGPDSINARKKTVVFPPEKIWALERGITVVQPAKIDTQFIQTLTSEVWDIFVVASYGKILPLEVLKIPKHGVLNMHPSLLPRLRGPSPIRCAILTDECETGVSIILLDQEMDHGPIIAQKRVPIPQWSHPPKLGGGGPPRGRELDELLAREGGALLASYAIKWVRGEVSSHKQNHDLATYCDFIKKEDGQLDLSSDAYQNLLKIRAYDGWPGTFAYFHRAGTRVRVKILDAHLEGSALVLDRVIPEGKREMSHEEFLRSGAVPA